MPSNTRTPEHDESAAQRRWSEELERDRMAGKIMEPGIAEFRGPGAVSASALGAARDAAVGDEEGVTGKAKGVAVDAAIAYATGPKGWIKFALKHKMILIMVLCLALLQMVISFMPLLVVMTCISETTCIADIAWKSFTEYLFGV